MDVAEYFKCGLGLHKQVLSKDFKQKTINDRRENFKKDRRQTRNNTIFSKRNIDKNMTPFKTPDPKMGKARQTSNLKVNSSLFENKPKGNRLELLQKWKADKEKRIAQERSKVKPIFKVCHVEENIGLPDLNKVNKEIKGKPIKKNPTPLKSQFAPPNHAFKAPSNIKPIYLGNTKPASNAKVISMRLTRAASAKNEATSRKKLEFNKDSPTVAKRNNRMKRQNAINNTETKPVSKVNLKKTASEDNLPTSKTPKEKRVQKTRRIETPKRNAKTKETQVQKEDIVVETPSKKTRGRPKKNSIEMKGATSKKVEKTPRKIETPAKTRITPKSAIKTVEKTPKNVSRTPKNAKKTPNHWNVEYTGASTSTDYPMNSINLTGLVTPEKQENDDAFPVYVSPFVTVSRGKNNARKEFQIRNSMSKSLTESPTFEIKDVSKHSSPRAGAEYFSRKLQRETERIEGVCNEWQIYKVETDIPTEAQDMIDVAIGQSRLLIAKKFQQFRGLVEQCRTSDYTEKPITCKDLHGFWDMIYMQVEDLDKRFGNLAKIRSNNWEEVVPEKKPAEKVTKKKRGRPASKKTKSSAGLKDMIKAMRNNKNSHEVNSDEGKTFDGGYFFVKSPISKTPSSLKRRSLRMSVLASEAQKRVSSPGLAMMRLSQAIKCGDGLTPGKSILKPEGVKSAKKSVLFKDDVSFKRSSRPSLSKSVLFKDDSDLNDENDANQTNLSLLSATRKSSRLTRIK